VVPGPIPSRHRPQAPPVLPILLALAACKSAEEHRAAADREVYALIDDRLTAFREDPHFTIERDPDSLRERILRGEWEGSAPLDLLGCVQVAAENNRAYQTQREALYLSALDLTFEKWQFEVQGFGNADAGLAGVTGTFVEADPDGVTGGFETGLTKALGSGGNILASIGASLFKVVSSPGGATEVFSNLSLSITQPLLRGFGKKVAMEGLTQAERNLVYQVRDFERFRRTFALDVATQFYDVVEAYNRLENERRNLERLTALRVRNERWAEAGRTSDIEVDQARQDELASESSILQQEAGLQRALDDFKFFLGLPVETVIDLDRSTLEETVEDAPEMLGLDPAVAVDFALDHRLDYQTVVDGLADNERKVFIAANDLRATLDLEASVNSTSLEGEVLRHDLDFSTWSVGAVVDLPISRLPERNAYRRTLIAVEVQKRAIAQTGDQVAADVRDSVRTVRTALQAYRIQQGAVTLAERRVRSSELSMAAGRSDTRDVLESQRALLSNQNSLTQAQIAYGLAQLQLLLDLELLRVDENGIGLDEEGLAVLLERQQP